MARAKRTQRAEARRRHRAATLPDTASGSEEGEAPTSGSGRSPAQPAAQSTGPAPTRMGFMAAFKAAVHPLHVRPDLAALPWIATRTHALWVPVAITIASTVVIIATNGGDLSLFMFAYFIQTPAIGGVFIAGFLAPRASWLLGVIVGLVSAACYSILVLFYPTTIYTGLPPTEAQAREVALSAFILSPIIGGFFAAGAAWYRRFLRLSSPGRNRQSQKPNQKKAGDGRTRGGSSQKAGAKR